MSDCTIKGIHIPKGMVVQADSWSIHNSHEYWPQWDPKEFHPERWVHVGFIFMESLS